MPKKTAKKQPSAKQAGRTLFKKLSGLQVPTTKSKKKKKPVAKKKPTIVSKRKGNVIYTKG